MVWDASPRLESGEPKTANSNAWMDIVIYLMDTTINRTAGYVFGTRRIRNRTVITRLDV